MFIKSLCFSEILFSLFTISIILLFSRFIYTVSCIFKAKSRFCRCKLNSVTISSILLFCIFVVSSVYDNKLKSKCSILFLSKFLLNSTPFSNFHLPILSTLERHNYYRALHKKCSMKQGNVYQKKVC